MAFTMRAFCLTLTWFRQRGLGAGAIGLSLFLGVSGAPAQAQQAPPLPRIIVLATGGTIAGQASNRAAIGYDSGKVSGSALVAAVPGLDHLATISAEQISSIGSQDMNDKVWFALAHRIAEIFAKNEADGVVITHGTDTMEETAIFLSAVVKTDKPIVLVGSMRPSTAIGADGPANLYEAMEVAASPQSRGRGVLVVLNDTIHSARLVEKSNTTSVQTFLSPNGGPVGFVDPSSVRFTTPPPTGSERRTYALPATAPLPRVDIIYAHANMDAALIEDAVKGGAKGLVLAGVGDGNGSAVAIDALAKAAAQGVVIIRSSRVGSGFVNRNVEVDDDKLKFAVALDLNPQKARVMGQLLIANGITDPAKVQEALVATW